MPDAAKKRLEWLRVHVADCDEIVIRKYMCKEKDAWAWDIEHDVKDMLEQNERLQGKYDELIMFVATKHPDESRHETAMRYIMERENKNLGPAQA